jgi:tetratricopeptide (TPR) repeat protein
VRRGQVLVLIAVTSTLLSVLLAVAVNVATGGTLPGPLGAVSWLAWPAVGLLAIVTVGLTIWQQRLADPASMVETGPARRPPAELSAAQTGFAGRASERAAIDDLLANGCRVLAVAGPPGAGKSALALHVAHDLRDRYQDGQLFAALRGASADPVSAKAVLTRFLSTLGVPGDERRGDVDDLAARFRSAVADRKVLILLDDARDTNQVRPLLPGGSGCLVLVTSRRQLTDLPNGAQLTLGGLDEQEGRALLASAVGDARVAADPEGAARIVRFCGGLPLAIRIAGARLRARPAWMPRDLGARLADEGRRLDELHVGDRAVRSTFETSYAELSTIDRMVFRRAGSHPGQVFGVGAAAALAGLAGPTVASALERLVDAMLVESPAPDRYRLHDLLRLFATERLAAEESPGDHDACLARLLDWLTTHAEAGAWLAQERDNVVAAVHRGVEAGEHERVSALVAAVHPLLQRAGDHPDRLALWRDAANAAAALGDDERRAGALRWVSNSYRTAGEVARALEPAAEAVAIADRLGDSGAQAEGLLAYGEALRDLNRFTEAENALSRALELFAELNDVDEEIEVRNSLGTLYNTFGQPELALPVLEPAAALLPTHQDPRRAWTLLALSVAYRLAGRRQDAAALSRRVFEMSRRWGDEFVVGYALRERGWLAYDEGRYDDADRDMRAALAVFERYGQGTGVGLAYEAIGEVACTAARYETAIAAFDAASGQFERLRDRVRAGRSRLRRADALAASGRLADARAEWTAAEHLIGDAALPEAPRLRERLRERLGEDGVSCPSG